jgi:putative acetyltransferase
MIIRRSRADDAARLHAIWRAAVEATHEFLTADDLEAISREVEDYVAGAPLWVAEDDGTPVGFMGVTEATIGSLFVDPACHGRGVGRALVNHAGASGAALLVGVNEGNASGRGFYERLGFRQVGRSDRDDAGRPYPLLHLVRDATS